MKLYGQTECSIDILLLGKTVPVRICAKHERQECMMVSPSICLVTGNIKIRW